MSYMSELALERQMLNQEPEPDDPSANDPANYLPARQERASNQDAPEVPQPSAR